MRFIGVGPAQQQSEVCYLTRSSKETLQTYSLSALEEFQKSLRRTDRVAVWKRLAIRAGSSADSSQS